MSYLDSFASVYDSFTDNVSYTKRTDYINSLLNKNKVSNGILLDLGCGTGSFSVEFSKLGYNVIGVDISPDMLLRARDNAEKAQQDILFLCQDMTELDLYGTVDCAICCLDTLNHLEDYSALRRTIEKVALFMRPGGVFVFDLNTLYKHKKVLSGHNYVYENEDTYLVWQNSECSEGSINLFIDVFTKDSNGAYKKQSEQFSETAFPLRLIRKTLKEAGFDKIKCYDDMTMKHRLPNSERVYFSAVKRKE